MMGLYRDFWLSGIDALDEQIKKSADTTSASAQKRKAELQTDWADRKGRLSQAGKLAAQALT